MRKFGNKNTRIVTLGVVALLLVTTVVGLGVKVLTASNSGSPGKVKVLSTLVSGTRTQTQYPGFKGLFQFTGNNTSKNSDSPYLAGTVLSYYWSQLEPQQGQFNWSVIDRDMQPWISHGKQVILRVATAGWTRWQRPYSASGTPSWVYNLGVSSVTETDGSKLPQYWNPVYLQNFTAFVHALAQKYDGNPDIAYINVGLGVGGEAVVDSHNSNPGQLKLWQGVGYTNAVWWNTIQQIITAYTSSFTRTPLALMPDKTFIQKIKGYNEGLILNYAVKHGLWLQDNGLTAGRKLSKQFMAVPHPSEQRQSTTQSGDSLQSEIQRALDLGSNYILIFSNDLNKPANQAAIHWAAALKSSK